MKNDIIYTRSKIQTLAGKAIRDLRGGGERELRNVVELCKGLSDLPNYRRFWGLVEEILHTPNQQYGTLLSRAANNVDINCFKTLVANFGLYACESGSQALRDNWRCGGPSTYWLEQLDENIPMDAFNHTIGIWNQRGASSFLLRAGGEEDLEVLIEVASKHQQCIFLLICRGAPDCRERLEDMAVLGNVIPLVEYDKLFCVADSLQQAGLLYGVLRKYADIESEETENEILQQCMDAGCFLGIYEGSREPSSQEDKRELYYYTKLQTIRRKGAKEILLGDLWRDRETIQELLLYQQPLPKRH